MSHLLWLHIYHSKSLALQLWDFSKEEHYAWAALVIILKYQFIISGSSVKWLAHFLPWLFAKILLLFYVTIHQNNNWAFLKYTRHSGKVHDFLTFTKTSILLICSISTSAFCHKGVFSQSIPHKHHCFVAAQPMVSTVLSDCACMWMYWCLTTSLWLRVNVNEMYRKCGAGPAGWLQEYRKDVKGELSHLRPPCRVWVVIAGLWVALIRVYVDGHSFRCIWDQLKCWIYVG